MIQAPAKNKKISHQTDLGSPAPLSTGAFLYSNQHRWRTSDIRILTIPDFLNRVRISSFTLTFCLKEKKVTKKNDGSALPAEAKDFDSLVNRLCWIDEKPEWQFGFPWPWRLDRILLVNHCELAGFKHKHTETERDLGLLEKIAKTFKFFSYVFAVLTVIGIAEGLSFIATGLGLASCCYLFSLYSHCIALFRFHRVDLLMKTDAIRAKNRKDMIVSFLKRRIEETRERVIGPSRKALIAFKEKSGQPEDRNADAQSDDEFEAESYRQTRRLLAPESEMARAHRKVAEAVAGLESNIQAVQLALDARAETIPVISVWIDELEILEKTSELDRGMLADVYAKKKEIFAAVLDMMWGLQKLHMTRGSRFVNLFQQPASPPRLPASQPKNETADHDQPDESQRLIH
jgi:hypothetical protein